MSRTVPSLLSQYDIRVLSQLWKDFPIARNVLMLKDENLIHFGLYLFLPTGNLLYFYPYFPIL